MPYWSEAKLRYPCATSMPRSLGSFSNLTTYRDHPDIQRDQGSGIMTSEICYLCPLQKLEVCHNLADRHEELDREAMKSWVLHEPCRRCDDPQSTQNATLCTQCRHLRLQHMLTCIPSCSDDEEFVEYDRLVNISISPTSPHCHLCVFISQHSGYSSPDKSGGICEIAIAKNGDMYVFGDDKSTRWLRPILTGTRLPYIQPYIDWQWLQQWISECTSNITTTKHQGLTFEGKPRNLRVIDVWRNCVVPLPPDATYLSLSYVWGDDTNAFRCERSNVQTLQQPGSLENIALPRTLRDSITACQRLGHRYLWIDTWRLAA